MATYKEIQEHVRRNQGFTPKTCWIADVKELSGVSTRPVHNRGATRKYPCPPNKRAVIATALSHFGVIRD